MERTRKGRDGADHGDENDSANNPVAWPPPRKPHKRRSQNSTEINTAKRSEAAVLALDLASNHSWSEAFVAPVSASQAMRNATLRQCEYSRSNTVTEDTELDPPPAYYSSEDNSSEDEVLEPAGTQRMLRGVSTPSHSEYGPDYRDSPHAPLLNESSEKPPTVWYSSTRANGRESLKNSFLVRVLIAIGVLCVFIVGGSLGYFHVNHEKQSEPQSLPLIPIGNVQVQHQTYEDIRGSFKLYDRLELSTTTGSIDIQIDPQPGNGSSLLVLKSSTGAIHLGISESYWMRRDRSYRPIRTEINTVSGTVYGRFMLGNGGHVSVNSVTGTQDLRIYVFMADKDDEVCELNTQSQLGDQVVALTNFGGPESRIQSLKAKHHSLGTANIDLQYSHAWRGDIHAVTSPVGHLEVQRDAYMVIDKEEEHEVLAHKGKDTPRNTVDAVSDGTGSITFKAWYTW